MELEQLVRNAIERGETSLTVRRDEITIYEEVTIYQRAEWPEGFTLDITG